MAREMNGDPGHTRGATAANESGSRRANTNSQCLRPCVQQPDHLFPPRELRVGVI
jgi:hypothetical protein